MKAVLLGAMLALVSTLPLSAAPEPRPCVQLQQYETDTIVVCTGIRRLYYIRTDGEIVRYPIGVGRDGKTWSGTVTVTNMKKWPEWIPPPEMLERQPYLPRRMAGGLDNPLGARAIYLGNTLYRIHGSDEDDTIGYAVSSGCFRMKNEDVVELYTFVRIGTKVVVFK